MINRVYKLIRLLLVLTICFGLVVCSKDAFQEENAKPPEIPSEAASKMAFL